MLKERVDKTAWPEYYTAFPCFSEQLLRPGCQPRKFEHTSPALKAIVLVHGLSDSPYFLSAVAEFFHFQLGYDVYLPLLEGHGLKKPDGLASATLHCWRENVRFAIKTASMDGRSLSIGGLSMGGALSFSLACTEPAINGDLFLFSAAFGLSEGWLGIAGSVKELLLRTPLALIGDHKQPLIGPNPYRYDYVSIGGAKELAYLIRDVDRLMDSFGSDNYFPYRIFSALTEYDDVVSLAAINRLRDITKDEHLVEYVIPQSAKVEHASVVLKDPIRASGADPLAPPVEAANPEFTEMMEAISGFLP